MHIYNTSDFVNEKLKIRPVNVNGLKIISGVFNSNELDFDDINFGDFVYLKDYDDPFVVLDVDSLKNIGYLNTDDYLITDIDTKFLVKSNTFLNYTKSYCNFPKHDLNDDYDIVKVVKINDPKTKFNNIEDFYKYYEQYKTFSSDVSEKLKIRPVSLQNLSIIHSDGSIINNVITDIDGNSYNGVFINGRVWMTSNLRTKHFNNGSDIYDFKASDEGTLPYYAYLNVIDIKEIRDQCGLYYNFHAIETGMLAPEGWHVPTIKEWTDLFKYIASKEEFNLNPNKTFPFDDSLIAKSVCDKLGWRHDKDAFVVGDNPQKNNSTNLSILPTGFWDTDGKSNYVGSRALYWSSSVVKNHTNVGEYISILYNAPCVYCPTRDSSYTYYDNRHYGFCVRCVKD